MEFKGGWTYLEVVILCVFSFTYNQEIRVIIKGFKTYNSGIFIHKFDVRFHQTCAALCVSKSYPFGRNLNFKHDKSSFYN